MEGTGFSFENVGRNLRLERNGYKVPKAMKTGTTICGVVYKDGIVLGADTRATEGDVVADKKCTKIHYIAPNIRCCGAGTAADTEMVTAMMASKLELHRYTTRKQTRVREAQVLLKQHLYKHQGHVGAACVLGGVDVEGPFLATVAPHGSSDVLPFAAMGSGSIAATTALETGFRDGMTLEEAKKLVHDAICAGIFNDPYSGTQVDLCVITAQGTEMLVGYAQPNQRLYPKPNLRFPPGTTKVLRETVLSLATVQDVPMAVEH